VPLMTLLDRTWQTIMIRWPAGTIPTVRYQVAGPERSRTTSVVRYGWPTGSAGAFGGSTTGRATAKGSRAAGGPSISHHRCRPRTLGARYLVSHRGDRPRR